MSTAIGDLFFNVKFNTPFQISSNDICRINFWGPT